MVEGSSGQRVAVFREAQRSSLPNALSFACLEFGLSKGSLYTALGHGRVRVGGILSTPPDSGKQEAGVAVVGPVLTEELEGGLGQAICTCFDLFRYLK